MRLHTMDLPKATTYAHTYPDTHTITHTYTRNRILAVEWVPLEWEIRQNSYLNLGLLPCARVPAISGCSSNTFKCLRFLPSTAATSASSNCREFRSRIESIIMIIIFKWDATMVHCSLMYSADDRTFNSCTSWPKAEAAIGQVICVPSFRLL